MLVGVGWMVVMRWVIRGIGLVSTIILARILSPGDFGLVAMASITVGLVEIFLAFGVDLALIQNTSATRDDFDSAWTLRIIQGTGAAALVIVTSPLSVAYFHDPRLQPILWSLAVGLVVGSMSNIGTVMFRKELQFDREFRFEVMKKVLSFIATISAAMIMRNYWALVVGLLTTSVLGTALSYVLHPYRPRLSVVAISKIWSFSQWALVTNLGYYLESRSDQMIIGGSLGAQQMGYYSIASEISQLPTTEIAQPISRAVVPGIARLRHEPPRLRAAFANLIAAVLLVAVPAGLGVSLVADSVVPLALGVKWVDAIPLVKVLGALGVIRITYGNAMNLLIATGRVREVALLTWGSVLTFLALAYPVVGMTGLLGIAAIKVLINAVLLAIGMRMTLSHLEMSRADLSRVAWRPLLAGAVMYCSLSPLFAHLTVTNWWGVIAEVLAGAAIYSGTLFVLWRAAGAPDGIETMVMSMLANKLKRGGR
jgi:O-antigen/teichoic acid export membrane protein